SSTFSDQADLTGAERRLRSVLHAELSEDIGHVVFHGPFGDIELIRDLLVARAAAEQAQDVRLARGQTERGHGIAARRRETRELADHLFCDAWQEKRLAPRRDLNRMYELRRRGVFQEITQSARSQRLEDGLVVVERREHEDFGSVFERGDPPRRLDAV